MAIKRRRQSIKKTATHAQSEDKLVKLAKGFASRMRSVRVGDVISDYVNDEYRVLEIDGRARRIKVQDLRSDNDRFWISEDELKKGFSKVQENPGAKRHREFMSQRFSRANPSLTKFITDSISSSPKLHSKEECFQALDDAAEQLLCTNSDSWKDVKDFTTSWASMGDLAVVEFYDGQRIAHRDSMLESLEQESPQSRQGKLHDFHKNPKLVAGKLSANQFSFWYDKEQNFTQYSNIYDTIHRIFDEAGQAVTKSVFDSYEDLSDKDQRQITNLILSTAPSEASFKRKRSNPAMRAHSFIRRNWDYSALPDRRQILLDMQIDPEYAKYTWHQLPLQVRTEIEMSM